MAELEEPGVDPAPAGDGVDAPAPSTEAGSESKEPTVYEADWLDAAEYRPPASAPESVHRDSPPAAEPQRPPRDSEAFSPPEYDADRLMADPRGTIDRHIQEYAKRLAGGVVHLDARIRELEAQVEQKMTGLRQEVAPALEIPVRERKERARTAISNSYREDFSKDPAFADPKVKQAVDNNLRSYYESAVKGRDVDMLDALSDPIFLKTVLYNAKLRAGYSSGSVPGHSTPAGAAMAEVRSTTQPAGNKLPDEFNDPELLSELERIGISSDALAKAAGRK